MSGMSSCDACRLDRKAITQIAEIPIRSGKRPANPVRPLANRNGANA